MVLHIDYTMKIHSIQVKKSEKSEFSPFLCEFCEKARRQGAGFYVSEPSEPSADALLKGGDGVVHDGGEQAEYGDACHYEVELEHLSAVDYEVAESAS